MMALAEEAAWRILSHPHLNHTQTLTAVQSLRLHAQGMRLQGGHEQLLRSLEKYGRVCEFLDQDANALGASSWHLSETFQCLLGMSMVYLQLQEYTRAEDCLGQAAVGLTQLQASGAAQQLQQPNEQLLDIVAELGHHPASATREISNRTLCLLGFILVSSSLAHYPHNLQYPGLLAWGSQPLSSEDLPTLLPPGNKDSVSLLHVEEATQTDDPQQVINNVRSLEHPAVKTSRNTVQTQEGTTPPSSSILPGQSAPGKGSAKTSEPKQHSGRNLFFAALMAILVLVAFYSSPFLTDLYSGLSCSSTVTSDANATLVEESQPQQCQSFLLWKAIDAMNIFSSKEGGISELTIEMNNLRQRVRELEDEDQSKAGELQAMRKEKAALQVEREGHNEKVRSLEEKLHEKDLQHKKLEETLALLEAQKLAREKELEDMFELNTGEQARKIRSDLEQKMNDQVSDVERRTKSELDNLRLEMQAAKKKNEELEQENKSLKGKISLSKEGELTNEIGNLNQSIQKLQEEDRRKSSALQAMREEKATLHEKMTKATAELEKANLLRQQAVKEAEEQKQNGLTHHQRIQRLEKDLTDSKAESIVVKKEKESIEQELRKLQSAAKTSLVSSYFDGAGGRKLSIGTVRSLGLHNSFTVSVWIKMKRFNRDTVSQLDNGILAQNVEQKHNCLHLMIRNGQPYMGFYGADARADYSLLLDKWYHVAFVYDRSKKQQLIYVDGVLVGSASVAQPVDNLNPVYLSEYANKRGLDGDMAGMRIHRKALSAEDISKERSKPLSSLVWAQDEKGKWKDITPEALKQELRFVEVPLN
eukprot:gene26276-31741_t